MRNGTQYRTDSPNGVSRTVERSNSPVNAVSFLRLFDVSELRCARVFSSDLGCRTSHGGAQVTTRS